MYLLGIHESVPPDIRDTVMQSLGRRGRVAAIRSDDHSATNESRIVEASLGHESSWQLTVPDGSRTELLDELAARVDYGVFIDEIAEAFPKLEWVDGTIRFDAPSTTSRYEADAMESLLDHLEETEPWESLESLIATVKASTASERAGAIATFTGRVRTRDDPDDTPTKHLEFEAYGDVAHDRMRKIEREIGSRPGVYEVALHHRTGTISAGEDIVFVVILAGHRDEAFSAVADGINRLKAEVPIFKKEVTVDEEFWVHTRP